MDNRPIGIFDSGVGGLTVVEKIHRILPNEKIIYFGDTARVPYGNKSKETVTRFSKEITRFLRGFKVKLIIVACNTASSLSLGALRRSFQVPVIGVIKPGVEEAIRLTKAKRIGVIGTEATISSNAYKDEIKSFSGSFRVIQRACPLFVPLVENRYLKGNITSEIVRISLRPLLRKRIDTLILGCTHYPLLKGIIKKNGGKKIKIVDSSEVVAKHVKAFLKKKNMGASSGRGNIRFFVSDNAGSFSKLARVFLKKRVRAKRVIL